MSRLIKLSSKQIEDIVEALPPCLSPCTKIAEKLREQIQNKLRLQLSDVKIVDNPEAIEKLKAMIRMQHYNTQVPAGEPIGLRAAESNAQPLTQGSLNAFHSAGSGSATTYVSKSTDAVRELYNVSQVRKSDYTLLHFKDKNLTFDDIIMMKSDIEGVTVKDLLISYLPEGEELRYKKSNEPWWYNLFLDLKRVNFPFNRDDEFTEDDSRNTFLRLKFDVNKLYKYNITPYTIAHKMEQDYILCIPSPLNEGIIDVFVNANEALKTVIRDTTIKGKTPLSLNIYNASLLFIQITLKPQLKNMYVNGIESVSEIYPYNFNSLQLLKSQTFRPETKEWRIVIDKYWKIMSGFPISKFINTLKMCNYEIRNITEDYIDVYSDDYFNSENNKIREKSPKDVITYYTKKAEEELDSMIEDYNSKNIEYNYNEIYPPILREHRYYYAYSKGCNFMKILSDPRIDTETTVCNNPHQTVRALGIEAGRNLLIKEYNQFFESVNTHHMVLIADYQTSKGILTAITSKGAARQNIGPLAMASFEQVMEAFTDAAAFGKEEQIKSTSTSIFVGKRMILGTGSFKARLDMDAIKRAEEASRLYKEQNPERFSRVSESTQKMFIDSLVDDNYLAVHAEDEGKNGVFGVEASTAISKFPFAAEFNYRNFVPKVVKTDMELPSFISDIINRDNLNENKTKLSRPILPPSMNIPVKGSLSKPGLPALPALNPIQITSMSKKINFNTDVDLDDFDEKDEFE